MDVVQEQLIQAGIRFRQWMHDNIIHAARHFGLAITGPPRFGRQDRSIGAPVEKTLWLRVVSEEEQWAGDVLWTGNFAANAFTAVRKPYVLDVYEWEDWRRQRAELMTLMPGSPCSPAEALRLPDEWWSDLRRTTDVIAAMPTDRVNTDQAEVAGRIHQHFGNLVDPAVQRWETAHGDLRWANLMGPDFGLLDWKQWGRAPAGMDAATLLRDSLEVPEVAERVREVFADVLKTDAGHLYAVARQTMTAPPSTTSVSPVT
ncbi:aminoglycoside phosphotransferase [Lentzea sp. NPDC005914]|uniref:aminoglycoside phosphotransferase n=1 Tax=Lentzea sp. NPDC005914 TaxID=3154572 RepID=UPI0033E80C62